MLLSRIRISSFLSNWYIVHVWKGTPEFYVPGMACVQGRVSCEHAAVWELLFWNQSHPILDNKGESTGGSTGYWPDAWWQAGDCGGQEAWSIVGKTASEAGVIIFTISNYWLPRQLKVQWAMLGLDKIASTVSWKRVADKPNYLTSSSALTVAKITVALHKLLLMLLQTQCWF